MATVTELVARPKITRTKCFINGKWVAAASGKTFATYHPATGEEIAQVAEGNKEDIDRAVRAAREAFENGPWATMDARDRGMCLYRLADLLEKNIDELAALETLDNGKPITEALGGDLPLAIDCLRYYGGLADKIEGTTIPVRGGNLAYTLREPTGVVGQIIPWNFPALMISWKWGPALAAGCTIVMKPAEQTPLTCLRFAELAQQAGIPDGVINVVPGFGADGAGAALVEHPDVDKIAFTGEFSTAQIIQKAAAGTMKRLTFELGGKSPNIVFADADLEAAVAGAHVGLFLNQGQSCCAGSRLFVEDSIHDEFVERLAAINNSRKIGNPFDPTTEQGPQIDQAQFDKILKYCDYGTADGAELVTGGKRFGTEGLFIEPTIFTNVEDDHRIARDEIFGPVLSVLKFSDMDQMIRRANDTNFGLAAAVWTRDITKAHHVARHVRAGTIWVNTYYAFDAAAPFGGFKQSGVGRELGIAGINAYTESKTVVISMG